MGMKCQYTHVEKALGDLGGNIFHINLKLQTDDDQIYSRVVAAISDALGYPKPVEEKRQALGFQVNHEEVEEEDE